MTGGVAFEALHQAGGLGTPIVVVLNDNGMSIAPNVGALSRYFNRVRLNPKLWHAREDVEGGLTKLPGRHRRRVRAPRPAAQGVDQGLLGARAVVGGARLGLRRRDRRPRRARAARARCARRWPPSARSSCTSRPSRARASRPPRRAASRAWRSGTPPSPSRSPTARPAPAVKPAAAAKPAAARSTRRSSARRSCAECERDDRVVGITAAMNSGTGLNILQKAMPERYFDVGIAEQQAVLFAAGLALQGAKPVAAIYSTFLQRAYDQIVHDVCLQKLNVVFAMDRAGPGRRRRPDPPRRLRHRLPALPAQHRADGAARRGDARPHAPHGAAPRRRPDRAALPARRGRRACRCRDTPRADRDRHRRDPARGRAASRCRLRHRRAEGAGGRRPARPTAASRSRSPTRASPSRSTPGCSPSSPPSTTCSSRSRRACWRAASAPPCGRPSPTAA